MKFLKVVIAVLFVMVGSSLYAQSNSKVIAVVNKADWCGTCQKHGERVITQVLGNYKEPQVTIVANDLTNDATKAESKTTLEKLGVSVTVAKENKTGQIILINTKTGKVIEIISVSKSNEELAKAFNNAIKKS